MLASLVILSALIVVGGILYLHHRLTDGDSQPEAAEEPAEECCGMHITCQKDSLLVGLDSEIVYYDDEELDRYRGRDAEDYSDDEVEEFRDVLLTLLPDDIAGWGRSLQQRGIVLPPAVRDELLLIVAEARSAKQTTTA